MLQKDSRPQNVHFLKSPLSEGHHLFNTQHVEIFQNPKILGWKRLQGVTAPAGPQWKRRNDSQPAEAELASKSGLGRGGEWLGVS